MADDVPTLIAKAIREADTSWFNEDYSRQAAAVLATLRRRGWEICPCEAPEDFVAFAVENLPFGRMKPEDLIRELYALMVENVKRFV